MRRFPEKAAAISVISILFTSGLPIIPPLEHSL